MSAEPFQIIKDLIKEKYTDKSTPVEWSGWKFRPIEKDDARVYCQRCGHYNDPKKTETHLVLIGDKEFESFICAKCGSAGTAQARRKSKENVYEWLSALKNKIRAFHIE